MTKLWNPQSFYKDQLMKSVDFFSWDILTKFTIFFSPTNSWFFAVNDWQNSQFLSMTNRRNQQSFFKDQLIKLRIYYFLQHIGKILDFFLFCGRLTKSVILFLNWWRKFPKLNFFFRHWLTKSKIFSREQLMKFVSVFDIR